MNLIRFIKSGLFSKKRVKCSITAYLILWASALSWGQELAAALKSKAVEIKSLDNAQFLLPMQKTFSSKRVIGLGEITHGTSEFRQFNNSLFKFLVEKCGYKVFALEASFTDAMYANNYVLYGTGDAQKAASSLGYLFNTKEFIDLIGYMRSYNERKSDKEKLKFYGIDFFFSDCSLVIDALKKDDAEYLAQLTRTNFFDKVLVNNLRAGVSDSIYRKLSTEADKIVGKMQTKANLDQKAYLPALIQAKNIKQCIMIFPHIREIGLYVRVRDQFMYENLESILQMEGQDAKMLLYCNTGHACKFKFAGQTAFSLGWYINQNHPGEYYAIGSEYEGGELAARTKTSKGVMECVQVKPVMEGSVGYLLSKMQYPMAFLDFTNLQGNKATAEWVRAKQNFHGGIGNSYTDGDEFEINPFIPLQFFDALLYIKTMTCAKKIN
ncbi:erythromycin esterase family protein [Hymenobacter terrenus]|uniref:erythromycin esterase family protein n=1 Tax=Hymenobacter terrenus TaxID=1629124 RepID=UPI000619FD1F|nr:erythromycin esterase family protein [Hymenobacter terrenus]